MKTQTIKKNTEQSITLPADFLFGAATSSHQIEGGNTNNDWWFWEKNGRVPESGKATDHYHRYQEDFEIAKQIGLGTIRISIEWSRIEPEPGKYNVAEIKHYRDVLLAMKSQGLHRMVTLHHFTLPVWAAKIGGFMNNDVIKRFADYCKLMTEELHHEVELWCIINEPGVYTFQSRIAGVWPPFQKSPVTGLRHYLKLIKVHKLAYAAMKSVNPGVQIGIAKNNIHYAADNPSSLLDKMVVGFSNWYGNHYFLNRIKNQLDFVGLNYYFTHTIKFSWTKFIEHVKVGGLSSDMGWRTYPEGIYHLVKDLHYHYRKPIYITENGIANARDDMRRDFIFQHLKWLAKAIDEGVNVKGYYYWSLIDNYEWSDGYGPKFGLVEINYETFKRTIRPSAKVFQDIQSN